MGFRRNSFKQLGNVFDGSRMDNALKHQMLEFEVVARWAEVVGKNNAAVSQADKLVDGILFVACKNSSWANELGYLKNDIVSKLNNAVRANIVKDIRFSARGYKAVAAKNAKRLAADDDKVPQNIEVSANDEQTAVETATLSGSEQLARKIASAMIKSKRLNAARVSDGWRECAKCGELFEGKKELCPRCAANQLREIHFDG